MEQVFAKLKALLRTAAARTTEAPWTAVGRLLARFPPAECARDLAHCGFGQSGRLRFEGEGRLDVAAPCAPRRSVRRG